MLSALFTVSLTAQAEMMLHPPQAGTTASPQRQIVYKPRTEINFEGVEVSGELVKPQGPLRPPPPPVPRARSWRAPQEETPEP